MIAPTTLHFVSGIDGAANPPSRISREGLGQRFAVIQATHVPGKADMHFDISLWETLAAFAVNQGDSALSVERLPNGREQAFDLTSYAEHLRSTPEGERAPPELLVIRRQGQTVLCMVTEFWCEVGGPAPYHDSYTYSLYGMRDVADGLIAWLNAHNPDGRWQYTSQVTALSPNPPQPLWQRLWNWLK